MTAAIILEHCSRADWREGLMGELARAGYRVEARNRSNLLVTKSRRGGAG